MNDFVRIIKEYDDLLYGGGASVLFCFVFVMRDERSRLFLLGTHGRGNEAGRILRHKSQ